VVRFVTLLGAGLSGLFFVVWFGPKSGEGFTVGWGEAIVMYLVIAAQLLAAFVLTVRLIIRRYRCQGGLEQADVIAYLVCAIPLIWVLVFNLVRTA
jgi:hypothetical protein